MPMPSRSRPGGRAPRGNLACMKCGVHSWQALPQTDSCEHYCPPLAQYGRVMARFRPPHGLCAVGCGLSRIRFAESRITVVGLTSQFGLGSFVIDGFCPSFAHPRVLPTIHAQSRIVRHGTPQYPSATFLYDPDTHSWDFREKARYGAIVIPNRVSIWDGTKYGGTVGPGSSK